MSDRDLGGWDRGPRLERLEERILLSATYYVDQKNPLAKDTNAGTDPNDPLLTISKAATKVSAGDTILISEGIYRESAAPVEAASGRFLSMPEETRLEAASTVASTAAPSLEDQVGAAALPVGLEIDCVLDARASTRRASNPSASPAGAAIHAASGSIDGAGLVRTLALDNVLPGILVPVLKRR